MDLFEVNGGTDCQNIDVEDKDLQLALEGLKSAVAKGQQNDSPKSTLRPPPVADDQPDFFVPTLYDIAIKDTISLMDVAIFRLTKSDSRKGELIRHELANDVVEVSGGAYGMASIYDYDLVLMMVSELAEQIKLHRMGKGPLPSRHFQPHSIEVFKFCRLSKGGRQYQALEATLDRLTTTTIKIIKTSNKGRLRESIQGFRLIENARVVTRTDTGTIGNIEITIPEWIYEGVCNCTNPEILTVNPDYFLIKSGISRFVYRLARKVAGTRTHLGFLKAKTP